MHLGKRVGLAVVLPRLLAKFVKPVVDGLKARRIAFQLVPGAADGGTGFGKLGIGPGKRRLRLVEKTAGEGCRAVERGPRPADHRLRPAVTENGVVGDGDSLADPADIGKALALAGQLVLLARPRGQQVELLDSVAKPVLIGARLFQIALRLGKVALRLQPVVPSAGELGENLVMAGGAVEGEMRRVSRRPRPSNCP